jgi:hypothetical protein
MKKYLQQFKKIINKKLKSQNVWIFGGLQSVKWAI